jgi:hypothetical protein
MAEIVNNYKIGVVSDDFSPQGLAKKIVQLSAQDLTALKENTQKAAMELSAEQNKVKLLELVNRGTECLKHVYQLAGNHFTRIQTLFSPKLSLD